MEANNTIKENCIQEPIPSTSSLEVSELIRSQPRRIQWTKAQKATVLQYFKNHIKKRKLPKKDDCFKFTEKYFDRFHNINWSRIKTLVYNTYRVMP